MVIQNNSTYNNEVCLLLLRAQFILNIDFSKLSKRTYFYTDINRRKTKLHAITVKAI